MVTVGETHAEILQATSCRKMYRSVWVERVGVAWEWHVVQGRLDKVMEVALRLDLRHPAPLGGKRYLVLETYVTKQG